MSAAAKVDIGVGELGCMAAGALRASRLLAVVGDLPLVASADADRR